MSLSPYLFFSGRCAEAIDFYQHALGAELTYKITFGEMPKQEQHSEDGGPCEPNIPDDAIAHASLRIADSLLMMSDGVPESHTHCSGFTLLLDAHDLYEGKHWFDALAKGGKIDMRWQETSWAQGFGRITDKYGIPWMINVVKPQ